MEAIALASYVAHVAGGTEDHGWDNIYREGNSCVILGEPGSGKSEELKHQAQLLRAAGKPAAYVDLRSLLGNSSPYLEDKDKLLLAWRGSAEVAWFFLDSVDESKLVHISDFQTALKRMATWVGDDANRARYVISSRISEWRQPTDQRWVEEALLSRQPSAAKPHSLKVLALAALNNEQARLFQAAGGPVDEDFFAAVEHADAWAFMRRPLDVSGLYEHWRRHNRLGTLSDVVEDAVVRLLTDTREHSELSNVRAREGVEHIAACLAFQKSVSLLLPNSIGTDAAGTTDLQSCLPPDWSGSERAQVIQCALFDSAAFSKVRFHHRQYQDYLAARWLARLMRTDLPFSELRHLLFLQGSTSQLTLRPSLIPVATWLACLDASGAHWHKQLRDDLLSAAPWVFFSNGDPQRLTPEYKGQILQRTVEHFKGRKHVRIDLDGPTLKRFADPALAPAASAWIGNQHIAADLRADYIALVRHGELHNAMASVTAVAIDATADEYLRATALICIADIGSQTQRREVLGAFGSAEPIPLRLGVHLIEVAYPHLIDEPALFALLDRIDVQASSSRSSHLYALDRHIEHDVPAERVATLLRHLMLFICAEDGALRADRSWAADWLTPLVVKLLGSRLDAAKLQLALDALELLERATEQHMLNSYRQDGQTVNGASAKHRELRRAWYWKKVARYRTAEGKEPHAVPWVDDHYSPLKWLAQDEDWWLTDIQDRQDPRDRAFALRTILMTCVTAKNTRPVLPPWRAIRNGWDDASLRRELYGYLRASAMKPYRWLKSQWRYHWSRKHYWRRQFKPIVQRIWRLSNQLHCWWGRKQLERGEWWNGSWFIMNQARNKRSASRWGSRDMSGVTQEYGEATVRAAMAGADRLWRQHRPPLPHEKTEANQTNGTTIFGLVALEAAWETDGAVYFQGLSIGEAEYAARYALNELNGLPPWFAALVAAHEQAVRGVVTEAIRGEWHTTESGSQFSAPTMQRLAHAQELPASLYLVALRELLQGAPPNSALVLRDALRLVLRGTESPASWLAPRSFNALESSASDDQATWWPWLLCLFLLDADRGLDYLERRFAAISDSSQDVLCQDLCASLADRNSDSLFCPAPDYERPLFLRRFIPWVYRHVRVADDVVHEGVFTPDARDSAMQFRGSLLGRLEHHDGIDADQVLAELSRDPNLADIRDFVLWRIDQRRAIRADQFKIKPADLNELLTSHERIPRSRADLFHAAWSRLRSFKDNVETAEISLRQECRPEWLESNYQDWLQRNLQSVGNGKYTIPSEAKIDPGKFPDLRFEAPNVDGAISIEVKVATLDHWSYEGLEERLRNQLVGQYLRATNARHGVFLLFRANKDRQWRPSGGALLS